MKRAEHRLEIARGLLGLAADANVMLHINCMQPRERDALRALVDWVEQYDLEDVFA